MAYELSREERYHKRAEELRAMADGMSDEKAKKALLDAAAAFDQLAETAKHMGTQSPIFRNPDSD